jgi:SAM-dependent methyltransferase
MWMDIGSGIGVFPAVLREHGFDVVCTEENKDSLKFINERLNIPCYTKMLKKKRDGVSLVHVLEHIANPKEFLLQVKTRLRKNGILFIEVPDADGFKHLEIGHDDFNSCHVFAYSIPTLTALVEKVGFTVMNISRVTYPERGLYRIWMTAKCD